MNELFINVKVDREERPDLDEIYMNAVQIMARQGGWPMTVFLTPDLKPFYGGTYYPPTDRYGRPGFPKVMHAVAEAFSDQNVQVLQQADQITAHLTQMSNVVDPHHRELTEELMTQAFQHYRSRFDSQHGGFGDPPQIPAQHGIALPPALLASQRQRQRLRDGRTHAGEDGARAVCMTNSVAVSTDIPRTHIGLSHISRRCFTTTLNSSSPILRRSKPLRSRFIAM